MDIVGGLPTSRSYNPFVLISCNYITRHLDAIPLKTVDVKQMAETLVTFFSRVGIPSDISNDQATNFSARVMRAAYHLLGVKLIRTNPYHLQT